MIVPVYVDSSLTGLNVLAYQLDISFNATYLTYDTVISTGSMTQSWTFLEGNVPSSGRLLIAGSGSTALSDTGRLVFIRFRAKVPASNVNTSISFNAATTLFNEGGIPLSFANGTITVQVPPSITVSPDTWLMTRSETQLFTVSGGTGPYSWSTTNLGVATIDNTGLLSGLAPGTARVVCSDAFGVIDTSGVVEVRGLKLSVRDTSRYQGQMLDLPINTTNMTGLNIVSGQMTVTYNQNLWTATGVVQAGTLLASAGALEFSVTPGKISISFAGSPSLTGSGVLIYVRLQATALTYGSSTIGFQGIVFNQDLLANTQTGTATVLLLPSISVSPGGTQTLIKGDSLQFTASGGTGPYTWSVSDSQKASISSSGLLKVKRGGSDIVRVVDALGSQGSSGTVNLYDFRLRVPVVYALITAPTDTVVEVPLLVTSNDTGFVSFQLKVTYTTSYYVKAESVLTSAALTSGWTVVPAFAAGAIQIAAAGVGSVTSSGTLVRLRFVVPDSATRPATSYLTLSNVLFNEGAPIPLIENGSIQIRTTNSTPVLSSRTPTSLDSVIINVPTLFTVNAYDPNGDPLVYTWKVDGALEQTGSSDSFNRAFTSLSSGTTVTAIFTDPFGWRDSTSWTFRVVTTVFEESGQTMPVGFSLGQNFPNPFNPTTVISFQLPVSGLVRLKVYSILGEEIATLVDQEIGPGSYAVSWDGRNAEGIPVASGVYFYRIQAQSSGEVGQGVFIATRRLILLK